MFTSLKHFGSRLRALFTRRAMDRAFQQELDSHLIMMAEDNVRRGMSPEQARRAALIRLGGPVAIQEQHRAVRGLPSVEATLQDVRFAFRLMARDPWFSA